MQQPPPAWSREARLVWGKTEPKTSQWLPLVQHLEDSAAMGRELFDRWLPPSLRRMLANSTGSGASAGALAHFLCGIHDWGKCSPAFAIKAANIPGLTFLVSQLKSAGFQFPRNVSPDPHGAIGQHVMAELLLTLNPHPHSIAQRAIPNQYAGIIGGHHGRNPTEAGIQKLRGSTSLGDGLWDEVRHEIWEKMARHTGATKFLAEWAVTPLPVTAQTILGSIVIVADWMASNSELFPYQDFQDSDRLQRALAELRLPPQWSPPAPTDAHELFRSRFQCLSHLTPQPVQAVAYAAVAAEPDPGLLIIEAPMGEGKTEAALMCAEVLAHRFGQGGIYFGLPTMATSNPMFERVRDWLESIPGQARSELNLAHGKAPLIPSFQDLVRRSRFTGIHDETDTRSSVQAATWFRGRKKSGLARHVVGTIDQGLFAALKSKHVTLRHLGIASKVAIIDEVHSADTYMRRYLMRLLEWLGAYRVPVVLMSATLPPTQRRELAEAYARGVTGHRVALDLSNSRRYPRITHVTDTARDYPVAAATRRREVTLHLYGDSVSDLVELVSEALAEGGCVGVICNIVRRAQERYDALREVFGDEVVLLHSKFVAPHRARREADLVRRLGRDPAHRPERMIVVGTQVLEQSLDIDFDLLITDIAPMDLLLQRIGRLHRHQRGGNTQSDRPASVRTASCYLTGIAGGESDPPVLDGGAARIYRKLRLYQTLATLGQLPRTISLPHEIPELVAMAYDEVAAPDRWQDAWSAAEADETRFTSEQDFRAQGFLLGGPADMYDLNGLIEGEATDPEGPRGGAAQVRDSDESLEVVVIARDADGTLRVLDDIGDHSGEVIPMQLGDAEASLSRAIAGCTVALPMNFVAGSKFDATVAELERFDSSGWQDSPWLAGQLFLVLDPDGRTNLLTESLAYDQELGLRVPKEEPT